MGAFCVLVQNVYLGVMIENVFSQSDLKIIQVQVCLWQSCLLRLAYVRIQDFPQKFIIKSTTMILTLIIIFFSLSVLLYHGYRSLIVSVPLTTTINELKHKLADVTQIPIQNQRIFYGNTQVCFMS